MTPEARSFAATMSVVEVRLRELGLTLPAPMEPPGNFKLVNVYGGIAYVVRPWRRCVFERVGTCPKLSAARA
jgi:hypothetical protein